MGKVSNRHHESGGSLSSIQKPVTTEELSKFTETEMLYHSNYIRLEVSEVLNHVSIKQKLYEEIGDFLKCLYKEITSIPESENCLANNPSWLKSVVKYPCSSKSQKLAWSSPTDIKVVGSFQLKTLVKDSVNVDVLLELPDIYLKRSDFKNFCYFQKRAYYLSYIAYYLSQNSTHNAINFSYFLDDSFKPVIVIKPPESSFSVRVHAAPPSNFFKEVNLLPSNESVTSVDTKLKKGDSMTNKMKHATPHYNNAMLMDMKMDFHLQFLHSLTKDNQAFKDAARILKSWLKHRQFDQGYGSFNGFIMSMFLGYLLYTNKINPNMSSYQIIRNVFRYLVSTNWLEEGLSFEPLPGIRVFHEHFEVVFVGPSGHINLCANMSSLLYKEVVHEAKISFELLNKKQSEFYTVFMETKSFLSKFDCILQFSDANMLTRYFSDSAKNETLPDYNGNCVSAILPKFSSILTKGLDNRVDLISLKPHSYKPWCASTCARAWDEIDGGVCFGLLYNVDNFDETLIKGPSADLPEAVAFRQFWGPLSELRRFKDGSICEAVLWEGEDSSQKCDIPVRICRHLLDLHCRIPATSIIDVSSVFDGLLQQSDGSSGEELSAEARIVFQELRQQITSLKTLPLSVTNVFGLSPVLRGTDVFPPCKIHNQLMSSAIQCEDSLLESPFPNRPIPPFMSAIEMICFFESSKSWPKEAGAIKRMKSAFCGAICNELRGLGLSTHSTPTHAYIFKKHCLFKLAVGYRAEKNVLQSFMSETGLLKSEPNPESLAIEKETLHKPRLATELESMGAKFPAYPSTCRLAKRWLSSQLLSNHFSHEAVDLLCAHVFLQDSTYEPPRSSQVGFLRFMHLISTHDFTAPIVVELKQRLTDKERSSISKYVTQHRDVLPAMCIMTSLNRNRSLWTEQGPERVVVRRMRDLARACLGSLRSMLLSGRKDPGVETVFTPCLAAYDVVIFIKSDFSHSRGGGGVKVTDPSNMLPAVEFDPVKLYLESLQESFGEFALFFRDCYKNHVIAVSWRPAAFQKLPFKIMSLSCKKLEDGKLVPNLEAIVEDFKILGSGLVHSIEWRKKK